MSQMGDMSSSRTTIAVPRGRVHGHRPKDGSSYVVHLTQENGIIDVSDLDYGIPDRVIGPRACATRASFPCTVTWRGGISRNNSRRRRARKAVLDEDLDQVLVANDLNLGDSRARVLYENNRRSATDPRPPSGSA